MYTEDLQDLWREHFSRLATPQESEWYDDVYAKQVQEDVKNINVVLNSYDKTHIPIAQAEVKYIISRLPNGKAKDEDGITAEHLKYVI